MDFKSIQSLDQTYVAHTYGRFPLALAQGKDAVCTDVDGKSYIDFTAGIGVNSLGFSRRFYSIALGYDLNLLQDFAKPFSFAEFYLQRVLEIIKSFLLRRIIRIPNEKILESFRAQESLGVIARQGILIFPKQERDLFLRFDQPFELCSALD